MAMLQRPVGSAFYKTGPLYLEENNEGDPNDKLKAKAKAKAEAEAKKAKRVYGETTRTSTTKDGLTTVTMSTPYTQSGTGEAQEKMSSEDWKKFTESETPEQKKARKAREEASRSGVETRSYTKIEPPKPKGIVPVLPDITAPVPDIKTPGVPKFNFSIKGKSGKTIINKKFKPINLPNFSSGSSNRGKNPCKSCN